MRHDGYNSRFWRYLANFWTLILFAAIIYDFITVNGIRDIVIPLAAVYVGVLAFFAGTKEFERWYEEHAGKHPGEIFVILWTLVVVGVAVADFILESAYRMPSEVVATYIAVLGVFAITQRSKSLFRHRKQKHLR